MPYKRRGYRRRRRSGGGFWNGVSKAYRTVAKNTNWSEVWKAISDIKTLVNVEKKYLDTSNSAVTLSNTAYVANLTGMIQGTDYNQREGNSIKANSIQCRYTLKCNPNITASLGQAVRVALVMDKDNQGSAPSQLDIFETADVNSPLNHTNGKRFSVLYDKVHTTAPDASNAVVQHKFYIPCKNHLKFSGATASATRENHIYLVMYSDTNTATNEPTVDYYARFRYVDN